MGWNFHAGYTFRAGPDFHDISFKNESIAYQVSLNEIGLIYSANDPVAGNIFFLDVRRAPPPPPTAPTPQAT